MFKSLEMISNCTDWTWRLFPRTIHLSIQQSPILCFEYLFPNWHVSLRNPNSLGIWIVVVWWHFSTFNSPPWRDFARGSFCLDLGFTKGLKLRLALYIQSERNTGRIERWCSSHSLEQLPHYWTQVAFIIFFSPPRTSQLLCSYQAIC